MKTIYAFFLIGTFSVYGNALTLHCIHSKKANFALTAVQSKQGVIVERYFRGQSLHGPQLAIPMGIDSSYQYQIGTGVASEYMNLTPAALDESNQDERAGLSIGVRLENFYTCIRR